MNESSLHLEELLSAVVRGEGDVRACSSALEASTPAATIRAALSVFGPRAVISTAFGAGGLCLLHLAQQIDPNVAVYYIDTGFTFPETDALVDRWVSERRLRLAVIEPAQSPEAQAAVHGDRLWERDPDRCCALRKVEPNERALAGYDLWIAALRRDESPTRKETPILERRTLRSGRAILKLAPLARWTKKEVWRYILEHDLPYNSLHDRNYPSVGCTHCTAAVSAGDEERAGRWTGREKSECGLHVKV